MEAGYENLEEKFGGCCCAGDRVFISDATTHPVKASSLFVLYAIIAEPTDIPNTINRSMFKNVLSFIK